VRLRPRLRARCLANFLRRVAVIKVAQRAGIPLASIRKVLMALPGGRTPTVEDWKMLSAGWKADLNDRITRLTRLRDQLDGCIGCGCLSLGICPLRNPWDQLSEQGPGPRLLDPEGACRDQAKRPSSADGPKMAGTAAPFSRR
jgi:MerR family redox-sensitive transcriptional activator SoxR